MPWVSPRWIPDMEAAMDVSGGAPHTTKPKFSLPTPANARAKSVNAAVMWPG